MSELISISEAVKRGVDHLRKPIWSNPMDHIKIDLFGDKHGPWFHLWSPMNNWCNKRDPVDFLFTEISLDDPEWEIYQGPLPDSDEYQEERARFDALKE